MADAEEHSGYSVGRERLFFATVAFLISGVLAHFVHSAWEMFFTVPNPLAGRGGTAPVPGVLYAPDAYRVGVTALIRFLLDALHPRDQYLVSAGIDFCCAFACLMLLYVLAVRGLPARPQRLPVVLLLLAVVPFPMAWVVPWQRPETMPSALYLAFALYCCARTADRLPWLVPLFAATLWQGFVRSDVAGMFGAGLLAVGALGGYGAQFRSRAATLASGAGVLAIAGAVQGYLQLVRFPRLTYTPGTAVLQWRYNLQFHNLQTGGIAVLPFVLLALFVAVRRIRLGAMESVVFAASGLYLVVWFAVGILAEVRIFVPYMLLLCVPAARTLTPWLMRSSATNTPAETSTQPDF